ncbi:hypothetical protein PG993_010308 [Apiospora rasikravindrae]|uniref:Uncharacterized protein n=1 Tax=Apiospora rasikravindrae TaxID=990691 RepID=A0ABR1SP70_9PEZI
MSNSMTRLLNSHRRRLAVEAQRAAVHFAIAGLTLGGHAVELPSGLHEPPGAERLGRRLVHLFGGVDVVVVVAAVAVAFVVLEVFVLVERRGVRHLDLLVEEAAVVAAGAIERAGLAVAVLAVALGPLLHVLLGVVAVVAQQRAAAGAVAEGPVVGAAVELDPPVRILDIGRTRALMGLNPAAHLLYGIALPVHILFTLADEEVLDTLVDVLSALLLLVTVIVAVVAFCREILIVIAPHNLTRRRCHDVVRLFSLSLHSPGRCTSTVRFRHFNSQPNVSLRTFRDLVPLPLRDHVGAVIERACDLLNPRRLPRHLIGRLAVVATTADAVAISTGAAEVVGPLVQHLNVVALVVLTAAGLSDRLEEQRDGVIDAHPAAAAPLFLVLFRLRLRLLLAPGGQLRGRQLLLGGLAELLFRGRELVLLAKPLADVLTPLFPFLGRVDLSLGFLLFVCLRLFGLQCFELSLRIFSMKRR